MNITVIMPVYNRIDHTRQSIESLFFNNVEIDIKLYVVDDRSTKATRDELKKLSKRFNFNLRRTTANSGPGGAKNYGFKKAEQDGNIDDLIYFSDNDVYFHSGAIKKMIEAYQEFRFEGLGLLGGGCHPYLKTNMVINHPNYSLHTKDAISGYSHLLSAELFRRFGVYDEFDGDGKKIGRSEDWALCQRMKNDGFYVASLFPEVVTATGKTDSYGDPATGAEVFQEVAGVLIK